MFSDTHFHFHYAVEKNGVEAAAEILRQMCSTGVFFGMDIGTDCEDLIYRKNGIIECMKFLSEEEKNAVKSFMHFSAGIWPDVESIKNRTVCMEKLQAQIAEFRKEDNPFCKSLVAIGEGGLDHHWNPAGSDGRCENDFNEEVYKGEMELFEMQLSLAQKEKLPFIVHSRDAYDDTVACIKRSGYNNGIIHCYSYGLEEAKTFLDLGWYISLSGSVTYVKKSKFEAMKELLCYIPEDRILLETDSPYLTPVPLRGQPNNPVNVKHTYEFVAGCRNTGIEDLCNTVDSNIKKLFRV